MGRDTWWTDCIEPPSAPAHEGPTQGGEEGRWWWWRRQRWSQRFNDWPRQSTQTGSNQEGDDFEQKKEMERVERVSKRKEAGKMHHLQDCGERGSGSSLQEEPVNVLTSPSCAITHGSAAAAAAASASCGPAAEQPSWSSTMISNSSHHRAAGCSCDNRPSGVVGI